MRKTLAVFDFDGTLFFQTYEVNVYAMNRALAKRGLPEMTHEQLVQSVGDTLPDIAARLVQTPTSEEIAAFCDDIVYFAADFITDHAVCHPDVSQMLKSLFDAGVALCVCSNGAKDYLYPLLDKFGLTQYFDTIWYARAGISKKEALGNLMRDYLGYAVYMAGDRAEDVEAGNANQCISIGISSDLNAFSSEGVSDFDLSAADFLVTQHAEITDIVLNEKGTLLR